MFASAIYSTGKPTRGGTEQEHCFNTGRGDMIAVHRFHSRADAEAARERLIPSAPTYCSGIDWDLRDQQQRVLDVLMVDHMSAAVTFADDGNLVAVTDDGVTYEVTPDLNVTRVPR